MSTITTTAPLDLGCGRTLTFTAYQFNPDHPDLPGEPRLGVHIRHDGCAGVRFLLKSPTAEKLSPDRPQRHVIRHEPFTVAGEVVCECGEIGYIQRGRWNPK